MDGLLRAFGLLLQQQSKPRQLKSKYEYQPSGSGVHAARVLKKHESDAINDLGKQLKALDPEDRSNQEAIEGLVKQLSKLPVKFVPIKRQVTLGGSKTYPYRSKKRGG